MQQEKGKLLIFILSLLVSVFLYGCSPSAVASGSESYAIDTTFSDFYRELGGAPFLGPVISPSFVKDDILYQYILSGLLVYDPNQVPLERFRFSPIAKTTWNINDLVEPVPADPSLLYINGHRIWEEAAPFYKQYGQSIIGLPLSGVKANNEKQRFEQYFEGLGFFRNYSDQPGQIHLLPYGYWMCGSNCQYTGADSLPPSGSYVRDYSETEQLFLQASERLGYGFTGVPLAHPTMAPDGYFEMIFENVVMFIDPKNGNQVRLRPLPSWVGIRTDTPRHETKTDWLSFFLVSDGLGYNVPLVIGDYIASHGTMAYSGDPITEYQVNPGGGYSQCFTNMCLEYHPNAPEQLRVRPHPLGLEYHRNGRNTAVPEDTFDDALQINVWEQYPLIPSGEKQIINIEATKNGEPVVGVKLSLVVKQPDGISKSYQVEPTGESGLTSIEIDRINGPNGAIVQYQVCVLGEDAPQVCFSRSYTIWSQ